MRTTLMVFAIVLVCAASSCGQIDPVVSDFNKKVDIKFARLDRHERPFIGTFRFAELPEPLKPVRVDFTLTVSSDYTYLGPDPWPIRVGWNQKAMRLVGDSVFHWPGPHEIGKEFSGSFEVIPLWSGLWGFWVYLDKPGLIDGKLDVRWCFDEDGTLSYLGKTEPKGMPPECTQNRCTFFGEDSAHVVQHISLQIAEPAQSEMFMTQYTVTPPFHVGDTSTVRYYLTAANNINHDLFLEFWTEGMLIVSSPPPLKPRLAAGESMEYEIDVCPLPVGGIHVCNFSLTDKTLQHGHRPTNTICCYSVFDDDGSLRFISDSWFHHIDSVYLPKSLRPFKKGDGETIHVFSDKDSIWRHRY